MNDLNKYIKLMLAFCVTFYVSSAIWGVSVVENLPVVKETSSGGMGDVIAGGVGTGLFLGLFVGVIILIIWLIIRNIRANERKHSDLLYGKYKIELEKCNHNKDTRLKWRNWKTGFLTFKRSQILLDTETGLKFFGYYDGEMIQKDKFYLIATYKITGIFTRDKDIVIIPYELRHKVKKDLINGNYVMTIKAESIDEALNTDYYAQCVFKDSQNKDGLISFNDYIQKEYMETYVLRQVVKDNLLDYKTSMDKAIELNPNIQYGRKDPKQ